MCAGLASTRAVIGSQGSITLSDAVPLCCNEHAEWRSIIGCSMLDSLDLSAANISFLLGHRNRTPNTPRSLCPTYTRFVAEGRCPCPLVPRPLDLGPLGLAGGHISMFADEAPRRTGGVREALICNSLHDLRPPGSTELHAVVVCDVYLGIKRRKNPA